MPYDRNDQLPKPVTHTLPGRAQDIFRNVVNSAISRGASDESAHRQAWGAVGHTYKRPKGGGRWSRRKIKKIGAGSLSYSSWTSQQQKAIGGAMAPGSPTATNIEGRLHVGGRKRRKRVDRGIWKGLEKFNPNHDERGRFSSGPGGGGVSEGRAKGLPRATRAYRENSKLTDAQLRAKYPDTKTGAFEFLMDSSQGLLRGERDVRSIEPDPQVARTWRVNLKDGQSAIVYLPGHFDSKRGDFEVGFSKGYPEYNPDQARGSDGRWSGGGAGGGVSEGRARGKPKAKQQSLKSIRAAYKNAKKKRDVIARSIRTLQARMTQFKRKSPAYRNAYNRLSDLKAQRTELTRAMARLSSMHQQRTKTTDWDWLNSFATGLPILRRNTGRSLGKADDLFAIQGHF